MGFHFFTILLGFKVFLFGFRGFFFFGSQGFFTGFKVFLPVSELFSTYIVNPGNKW